MSREAKSATAIEFAIAVVASRSLPEKRLRERIAARYSADETEAAIVRLRELHLVDDTAWAERYTRDRFERCGRGRHRIRMDLVARGIDAATAESAIAAALGEDAEREKATAVLASMRAKLGRGETAARILENRLFRRMLARGYPASLVRDLLGVS